MDLILPNATVLLGDCVERLKGIADKTVQMCVTSPPYFGLRDYGVDGQLGLEDTPEAYIAGMVEVFREVRRVLADDGTLWVNIGDSYSSRQNGPAGSTYQNLHADHAAKYKSLNARRSSGTHDGLKHKDLIGIPWMLAFALRADGWYLRQDIIWQKPNPMPESVTDRCTKAHEYIFLLSKSQKYFYDHEAVKEPAKEWHGQAATFDRGSNAVASHVIPGQSAAQHRPRPSKKRGEFNGKTESMPGRNAFRAVVPTRNRRSVWTVATRPYKGAHFATFPPALIEPCILAGTSEGGHCPECGIRWERVQGEAGETGGRTSGNIERKRRPDSPASNSGNQAGSIPYVPTMRATLGWSAACTCNVAAVPDTVLDPFNGSGTTGQVALQHGRQYIGCELNPEYVSLTNTRLTDAIKAKAEADSMPVQFSLID